jgi:two-component system NtrC family sensor kinase
VAAIAAPVPETAPLSSGAGTGSDHLGARLAGQLREAQNALLSRPRFSIRMRLITRLGLCLGLCCAFSIAVMSMLGRVRTRLGLLEATEELSASILRARALESEGALTAGQSRQVLRDVSAAATVLGDAARAVPATGAPRFRTLLERLETYKGLLEANQALVERSGTATGLIPSRGAIVREKELEVVRLLDAVIAEERSSATRTLEVAESAPLVLIGLLVALFGAIIYSITRALEVPIRRFQGYTSRIADGDFSLIAPARTYRDEFTDLALAVNEMLAELSAHQARGVKAAKLAAVGTLTSGIAHELNNPLNNIAITTEALMEELPRLGDDEKWRLLEDIYFETERAGEIVKSLLDFTRQEKPEMVPLDLVEVVQSTVRLAQNEMALSNVVFSSDLPADLPRVRGAANQLRQVFLNLLLNAIQAMPGGGRLHISAGGHEEGKVCVEVRDDGAGIAPETLPHIFDPFFTTKEPGKGTGLGLSVSLGIVRKFGGDIQVTSEPHKGTVVHVCLPEAGRDNPAPSSEGE